MKNKFLKLFLKNLLLLLTTINGLFLAFALWAFVRFEIMNVWDHALGFLAYIPLYIVVPTSLLYLISALKSLKNKTPEYKKWHLYYLIIVNLLSILLPAIMFLTIWMKYEM